MTPTIREELKGPGGRYGGEIDVEVSPGEKVSVPV